MRLLTILLLAGLLPGCTPRILQKHGTIAEKVFRGGRKGDIDAMLGIYVDFESLKPLSRKMGILTSGLRLNLGKTTVGLYIALRASQTKKETWRSTRGAPHKMYNRLNVIRLRNAPEEIWISVSLDGDYIYYSEWIHVKLQHRNWSKTGHIPVVRFPDNDQ